MVEPPPPFIVPSVEPFDIDPDVLVVASFLPAAALVPEFCDAASGATPVLVVVLPAPPIVLWLEAVPEESLPLPVVTGDDCAAANEGATSASAKIPATNLDET